ncbi:MAG: hypothetical protein J0L65_13755 [Xanthomonadales bacterium]|nr:hypothetical protein [Xanthomonadales bacterium]
MSLSSQIASGFARVVAAINTVDAKVSGAGISGAHPVITKLLSSAAQARNNNPRVRSQMVDPPAVVVTASQPAALTRTYSLGSGSPFLTSGGTPSTAGGFTSFPSTTFTVGQLPFVWRVETVVDADTVSFQLDSAAADGYRFIVDGEYVSETGSNYNSGSPGWYTLQFASRAMRSIIVEGRETLRFGAVAVAPTAKCLLPVGNRLRAYFVGDSNAYVYGLAQKCNSYAAVIADCLGVADITINAISGSGFSVNGGFKSYGEREADWNGLAEPLDLLIFQMSVNDIIADVPAATIKASVAARLSAARAAHPGALIVVFGVVTWDEWGTTFAEHETAAAEAVAEASDAGMLFVPVRNAPEEEILTGSALAFDGTASFYVDDSAGHLGYAGNTYVGRWLADRLVDAMAAHAGIDAPQALPPPPAVDADVFATPVVAYASGTQRDVAAGASSTFSLPGTVAAGNACIVAIAQWQDGDAITAVTVGGVAAIRDVRSINPINTNFRAEIWRTPNATAEHARTVVITYESGVESVWIDCGLIEVSGLHDAPLSTAGTSSGTADAISTSAINVSLPRSLVVSATGSVSSSTTHTYTELSGQTQIWEEPDSVNWMAGVGGYSVSGVGVAQHAWSVSPTTDRWASAVAAYRPALAATSRVSATTTISGDSNVPIGYLENKQLVSKASLASQTAGTWVSLWRATGYPAQGAIPGAAAVCTDTTTGAHPLPTSTAGAQYWAGHTIRSGNSGMLTIAYDRLAHMGGLVGNVATAQNANIDLATLGVSAARIGASDYTEIDWWLEWYTATGSTAVNATVNVTYSDASTGNLNTISLAATRPAGFCTNLREYLPTAKAGLGIKGVNTVTLSATTGTAGSFGVTAGRLISEATTLVANYPTTERFAASAMPDIRDDSCIAWTVMTSTTSSGTLVGAFSVIREA